MSEIPADQHPPQGATTLIEVLDGAAAQGHSAEFVAELDASGAPRLRCPHCGHTVAPDEVDQRWATRLEGASDPSDMAYVAALVCDECNGSGVYVARFGPEADAADAAALRLLPAASVPGAAPDRS